MALDKVAIIVGQLLAGAGRVKLVAERCKDERLEVGCGNAVDRSGRVRLLLQHGLGNVIAVAGVERQLGLIRFIPARAGNAKRLSTGQPQHSVHPRACGERSRLDLPEIHTIGSSPRVRGTRGLIPRTYFRDRFIPARAGNAQAGAFEARFRPVHPRACGEREGSMVPKASDIGSSPRVRGTPHLSKSRKGLERVDDLGD
jgi:hypothetical protein